MQTLKNSLDFYLIKLICRTTTHLVLDSGCRCLSIVFL